MAKKYYAVAKGRIPGIYFSWEDCKAQIDHFSGAVYKSFSTAAEAQQFIEKAGESILKASTDREEKAAQKEIVSNHKSEPGAGQQVSTEQHLVAYVDGSYEHNKKRYAYGCAIILSDEVVTLNGSGAEEEYVSMRNVAGEILGSEQAVNWAIEHGYLAITIYYDYEGIEKWANGIWKANKPGTKRYQEFIVQKRKVIDISFQKVAAHTGVEYNEMADRLAKEALGIL